jgi:hypothetical protein
LKADLKTTQDEVLRRVGRNLLLFQQIEQLLKFILSNHKAGGVPEDFKEKQQMRTDTLNKTMLGNLVDKYVAEVLKDAGVEASEEECSDNTITYSFQISVHAEFIEAMRRDMKLMTEQRNELAHGFLSKWLPDSAEKLEDTLSYLDTQREKVLPMHEYLRTMVNHFQESQMKLLEFISSDEYQKQSELMWLQASPLVSLLRDVAFLIHRKDGWSDLARAGRVANNELPEEVKNLNERYGFKTLKKLLIGSEMFDVFDEPLSEGRFRTLYKNKEICL